MRLIQLIESKEGSVLFLYKEDDLTLRLENVEIIIPVVEARNICKEKKMREIIIGDENTASVKFVRQDGDSTIEITMTKLDCSVKHKFSEEEVMVALRFITNN